MITIFNREEVYNGFSMEKFSRIRDILQANHIKYNYKCVSQNRGRETFGTFGRNLNFLYEYYVFVHKDDYEQACYMINQNKL